MESITRRPMEIRREGTFKMHPTSVAGGVIGIKQPMIHVPPRNTNNGIGIMTCPPTLVAGLSWPTYLHTGRTTGWESHREELNLHLRGRSNYRLTNFLENCLVHRVSRPLVMLIYAWRKRRYACHVLYYIHTYAPYPHVCTDAYRVFQDLNKFCQYIYSTSIIEQKDVTYISIYI